MDGGEGEGKEERENGRIGWWAGGGGCWGRGGGLGVGIQVIARIA